MLKKTFLSALFFCSASLNFASAAPTLTVAPYQPATWAYINAKIFIHSETKDVNDSITVHVSENVDTFSLTDVVIGNGIHPKIHATCKNIQIEEDFNHQMIFHLENDYQIHCQYS